MIEPKKIKIVLIETSHPGNIGSAARAMKTMGFSNLFLVNPKCEINDISYAMASNAGEILDNLIISDDLPNAIGDCNYIIGATARQRDMPIEILNPRKEWNANDLSMLASLFGSFIY